MAGSLEWALASMTEHRRDELAREAWSWPSSRYREDPVSFAREILGVEPWSKQIEILEAVRDHRRVAVSSGHKCGKSHTAAIIALWFYCSFPDARVCMTSVTARQVDAILYREVRKLHSRARRPIDGDVQQLARSGIHALDFREIVGFTAKEKEAVAGVSGANILYIPDEASGIDDEIFEAIEGNRAGGGRIVMFSNPTRTEGEFFEAFNSKAEFYKTIQISAEDSPNVVAGKEVIPGLAMPSYVKEKLQEWGRESAQYKIRVLGQFALNEDGKILSTHMLLESELRWPDAKPTGRLYLGVDPAGDGEFSQDESCFVPRRGAKQLGLHVEFKLGEEAVRDKIIELLAGYRYEREQPPVVVIDRDGVIGSRVYGLLLAYLDANPRAFVLVGIRGSEWATREPMAYERQRDELWANFRNWMKPVERGGAGGAIIADAKLTKELHTPEFTTLANGKQKATDKKTLRKLLGRSPDRADALVLSTWEPSDLLLREEEPPTPAPPPGPYERRDARPRQGPSPYASNAYGGRRR